MTNPAPTTPPPSINPTNNILVCTDGSSYATSIYDHAAWVANRTGARLQLVHMLDPHHERADHADLSGNLGTDTSDELLHEFVRIEESRSKLSRERGKLLLAQATQYLAQATQSEISTLQQHGELVETVTLLEENADLLVLGKRGQSADFAKLHLGSNLERVIRASIRPVLVASRQFHPITNFLIAYDGGPSIEKAIRFAQENPLLQGLQCHLLRAGRLDADARWFLEEAASKLRDSGYSVTTHAKPGDPEHIIAELVQDLSIHLLVMGAYGHSRIRHLIVGSTTTTAIRTCLIPILLFR